MMEWLVATESCLSIIVIPGLTRGLPFLSPSARRKAGPGSSPGWRKWC